MFRVGDRFSGPDQALPLTWRVAARRNRDRRGVPAARRRQRAHPTRLRRRQPQQTHPEGDHRTDGQDAAGPAIGRCRHRSVPSRRLRLPTARHPLPALSDLLQRPPRPVCETPRARDAQPPTPDVQNPWLQRISDLARRNGAKRARTSFNTAEAAGRRSRPFRGLERSEIRASGFPILRKKMELGEHKSNRSAQVCGGQLSV